MPMKKARILVATLLDGTTYTANQVIEADASIIKELVNAGFADDKPAAVKYCIDEEGAEVITHTVAEPAPVVEESNDEQTGELAADDEAPPPAE